MDKNQVFRILPKMSELLDDDRIIDLMSVHSREHVKSALNQGLDALRQRMLRCNFNDKYMYTREECIVEVVDIAKDKLDLPTYRFQRVINATGIVLHTNLGRAPLPSKAVEHMMDIARCYSNLEYDLKKGERGERYHLIADTLCEITGSEASMVVNNNAAAVLLSLSALASGKKVIVSRGEMVEIGGSFRIPDVLAQSGAQLVEVGTTNKTHLRDYQSAIDENTALILKVHPSNYKIMGFSSRVEDVDLKELARKNKILLMKDLGSGALVDLTPHGYPEEPTVMETVGAGVDIITFSGDKLLGGPQAGIILGKKHLIDEIKAHPLTRAVRVDKFTLAALESVLWLYKTGQMLQIPVFNMLTKSLEEMEDESQRLAQGLQEVLDGRGSVRVLEEKSEVGGGSLPTHEMATKVVGLKPADVSVSQFSSKLRKCIPPVIARIKRDTLLLDTRTLLKGDIDKIIEMVGEIL